VAICREFEPLLAEVPGSLAALPAKIATLHSDSVHRYQRLQKIGDFFVEAARYPISGKTAEQFSRGWSIQHNLLYVEDTLQRMDEISAVLENSADKVNLQEPLATWFTRVSKHMEAIFSGTEGSLDFVELAPAYEQVKLQLLQAALSGKISRSSLDNALQMCSLSRRLAEQWLRALSQWRLMSGDAVSREVSAEAV